MRFRSACAAITALILMSPVALGVPTLQLYSPHGTYDPVTETWRTSANPFELWVIGARTPEWIHYVTDVMLYVAITDPGWVPSAAVTITGMTGSSYAYGPDLNPVTGFAAALGAANLTSVNASGDPEAQTPGEFGLFGGQNFPKHGIYPTFYWAVALADLEIDAVQELAFDFNQGFDPADPYASGLDVGDVQYYQVAYSPAFPDLELHFDLTGLGHNDKTPVWRFAPFSHDTGTRDGIIPEPATVTLLLVGLVGLALRGSRRRS